MQRQQEEKSELDFITELLPKHKLTRPQLMMGAIGLGMGTTVVYAEFTLGAGFGDYIADQSLASSSARQFLEYFFGLSAMIPTAALVAVPTQDKLISMFERSRRQKTSRKNKYPMTKKGVTLLGYFAVSLTGAPFAYILVQNAEGDLPLQIFWATLTMITSYLCTADTVLSTIEKFFNRYDQDREEIKRLQHLLFAKLNTMLATLYQISDDEVTTLFSLFTEHTPAVFLQELQKLSLATVGETSVVQEGVGKKILDGLAILTGTAATYALYALTETASEWVLNAIGLHDKDAQKGIANTIALLSTIPNTLFLADFTQQKCNEFYYRFNDKNFKPNVQTSRATLRNILNGASMFIGCLSAIGNTYLAIKNADPKALNVFVPFSFLGSAFAQAKAMDMLLQRGIDYYDRHFYPQAAFTQRDLIIKVLTIFKDEISHKLDLKDLTMLNAFFSQDVENKTKNDASLLNRHGLFHAQESKREDTPALQHSVPSFSR